MAVMRYHRGSDFDVLRREMSRLFDYHLPDRSTGEQQESAVWSPRADLSETDDAFFIAVDLPGIDRDELDITVEESSLKISGERSIREEHEQGQFHRIERSYGRFYRSFNFGPNVDPENVNATFDDGVLTVRVGKVEERKPRRIEVGSRQELEATS